MLICAVCKGDVNVCFGCNNNQSDEAKKLRSIYGEGYRDILGMHPVEFLDKLTAFISACANVKSSSSENQYKKYQEDISEFRKMVLKACEVK